MNILFTCDSNYVMPLSVSLASLFENNKNANLNIYVLHSKIDDGQIILLTNLAKSYGRNITLLEVDENYFDNAPVFKWSKAAYYRLLLSEYLPKGMGRILYLDCDTIIDKPIDNLYNTDLGDYYLMASMEKKPEYRKRLRLDPNKPYFQTGVMLVNLDKYRELLNYQKAEKIINDLGKELFMVDESVINIIFDGKIKPIEQKYNNYYVTQFEESRLNRLFNHENKKMIAETCIFHFIIKPWYKYYSESCENVWYKYLKLSPYKNLYNEKFSRFKYKILRTGLMKTMIGKAESMVPFMGKIFKKILSQKAYGRLRLFYITKFKNEMSRTIL